MLRSPLYDMYRTEERAVSPVIGVILMVAITVILAAVLGAFVLEIGDQQETAPNTSLTMDERMVYLDTEVYTSSPKTPDDISLNTTQVGIVNSGGDTIPISQTEIVVEGHRDAWGISPHHTALEKSDGKVSNTIDNAPQPDYRRTVGSNEPVYSEAGDTWNVVAYDVQREVDTDGDDKGDILQKSLYKNGRFDVTPPAAKASHNYILLQAFNTTYWSDFRPYSYQCECTVLYFGANKGVATGFPAGHYGWGPQLEQEDRVDLVWKSASGGKTQVLRSDAVNHEETSETIYG